MLGVIIFFHVVATAFLVVIILMQSGRGGGLTEAFSSAESMFGAKTNELLVKATTVFAVLFLVTSLSLAFVSSRKGKSIMSDSVVAKETAKEAAKKTQEPAKVKETTAKVQKTIENVDTTAKAQAVNKAKEAAKAAEAALPKEPVAVGVQESAPGTVK